MLGIKRYILLGENVIGVSDGSYKDGFANHGWVLSNAAVEKKIMSSALVVEGDQNQLNAFRAEAFGLLTLLTIIECVDMIHDIKKQMIDSCIDCESLISKVQPSVDDSIKHVEENEMDVVLEIRAMIARLKCTVSLEYVKVHQDNEIAYDYLPYLAQLNCDMNDLAKRFMKQHTDAFAPHQKYPILPA